MKHPLLSGRQRWRTAKMNAMPSQSQDFSPTNTARGRTYIFGGEVRF